MDRLVGSRGESSVGWDLYGRGYRGGSLGRVYFCNSHGCNRYLVVRSAEALEGGCYLVILLL